MGNKRKESALREKEEIKEGKEIIDNQVPDNRVQSDQQVATTEDAQDLKPIKTGFEKKKIEGKGSELKTEKISDLVTGSGNTSGMGISAGGRSASGTGGGVLGANNRAPQAEQSRGKARIDKKLDRIATKLNYTPCEQAVIVVDESKPLADASDLDQGYNGTYRNIDARSQKIAGAVPADLMYQRSVDYIFKDKLYFLEGQMNFQSGDDRTAYYPSKSVDLSSTDNSGNHTYKNVNYTLGNYLIKNLHFKINTAGKVEQFYADVEDLTATNLSPEDVNSSSAHKLIKMNVAELDRMNMDAKAGDEKADIWSCLPRAIAEPTKAAALMSTYEAETGGYVHLAYSKATTNMSHQINKGPKDGLDEVTPAIEQLVGWRSKHDSSTGLGTDFGNALDTTHIFNRTAYRAGDPALMIEAYDSIGKYKNKADLLLQPRSFRMHLQTADNNMNPLRVPKEYANVYAATETYSTVGHEYDPSLPICITDKANLIIAHNVNETTAFNAQAIDNINVNMTYQSTSGYDTDNILLFDYKWLQATGYVKVGLAYKKISGDGAAVWNYDGTNKKYVLSADGSGVGDDEENLDAIILYEVDEDSGNLIVPEGYTLASSTTLTVADMTANITIDLPKVGSSKITETINTVSRFIQEYYHSGAYVYQYSDLRNNYIMEVKHPLFDGIIAYLNNAIGAKFRALLQQEDFLVPMVFSTQHMTLAQILICAATPWIIRVRENAFKDVIYYEDNIHEYPYSKLASLKEVPFKNYVNFSYTDYDSPIETKIMNPVQAINWTMPSFFWKVGTRKYVLPWYFNENDLNSDGTVNEDASNMSMPSIRSGVRLSLLDDLYGMSEKDIRLSLDRETKYLLKDTDITNFYAYKYGRTTDGQILACLDTDKVFSIKKILTCPRELGLSMDAPLGVLTIDPADVALKDFGADGTSTSYRIKVYTNKTNTTQHPTILSAFGVSIIRGSNYVQKWFQLTANNATTNTDVIGLIFGLGDDVGVFSPFAALGTGASAGLETYVNSKQRSLNTRLQFLPFIISPFDGNFNSGMTYTHDIYDFAYMFGLCGFRASDYRESVYNREKRAVNEGILFVSDPWIEDSPIINGAAKSTGVKNTVGYELK